MNMHATANLSHTFKAVEVSESDPGTVTSRLEWIRNYHGKSQKEFALSIGVLPSTYSNWLYGPHGVSLQGARLIKRTYNVSLDFLFFGDTTNLPDHIRKAWNCRAIGC